MAEPRSCESKTDRLVFTPDNWNVPQKIYVDAIEDEEYETKGHDFDVKLCHVAKGAKADCSSDSDAVVIKGVLKDNEADSTTELEDIIDKILGEVCADSDYCPGHGHAGPDPDPGPGPD